MLARRASELSRGPQESACSCPCSPPVRWDVVGTFEVEGGTMSVGILCAREGSIGWGGLPGSRGGGRHWLRFIVGMVILGLLAVASVVLTPTALTPTAAGVAASGTPSRNR